ncbi:MAG TPA: hypothetical protein VJX23_13570 [Candidatus Binataceae bacterium]|nr:hypothetical protein [Candidatus Binataceae bacterium]
MAGRAIIHNDLDEFGPLRIGGELKVTRSYWKRVVEGVWNPSRLVKGLSLLAGYVAGEAYSIYAVFGAHALTPVTAYLREQTPYLRGVSGKYREVLDLDGLIPVLLVSLVVFAAAWCIVRGVALVLADSRGSADPGTPCPLATLLPLTN